VVKHLRLRFIEHRGKLLIRRLLVGEDVQEAIPHRIGERLQLPQIRDNPKWFRGETLDI
jgi:hypothetical protein